MTATAEQTQEPPADTLIQVFARSGIRAWTVVVFAVLFLVCALLIHAGLYGIENRIPLPEEMDAASAYLPGSRKEAGGIAAKSSFIRDIIPEGILRKYIKST